MTPHDPPTHRYTDKGAVNRAIAFSLKVGAQVEIEALSPGLYIDGRLRYRSHPVKVYSHNFEKTGVDRAGSMKNIEIPHERSAPCMPPFETVTIAFGGWLYSCCQFYPDFPQNYRCSVGRVEDFGSLFDAYCSPELAAWRRSMFRYGPYTNGPNA